MDILNKLKVLKTEDFIWFTYFFIAIFAVISNAYERNYVITGSTNSFKKSKTINISLFLITFFIYLYFVLLFYDDLKKSRTLSPKELQSAELKFIAALLFLLGGGIFLIQEVNSFYQ